MGHHVRQPAPGARRESPSQARAPGAAPAHPVLALQRAAGNQAVAAYLGQAPRLARKNGTKAAPVWYQKLLDRIAEENRSQQLTVLWALEALAKAIDGGKKDVIGQAVTDLGKAIKDGHMDAASASTLDDLPMQMMSRAILAGAPAEAERLRTTFGGITWTHDSRAGKASRLSILREVKDLALSQVDVSTPDAAEASIAVLLVAVSEITSTAKSQDQDAIKKARQDAVNNRGYISDSFGGLSLSTDEPRTPSGIYGALLGLLPPLITALWKCHQVLMDKAIADLGSADGPKSLARAKTSLMDKMGPVLTDLERQVTSLPSYNWFPGVWLPEELDVEVTRSTWGEKKGKHHDFFIEGKKSPSVDIERYDASMAGFPESEKSMSLTQLMQGRVQQIAMLERLSGQQLDDKKQVTAESAENEKLLKGLGGFKLHNNDDWRKLCLAKFKEQKSGGKTDDQALAATIDLLASYLKVFTMHSPLNIDEFGDNYLSRTFPRALTGQLIHDCGVYALRIAYALSLVRDELGLAFRAVLLPVHVGLIITFKDPGHAVFITHNDSVSRFEESPAKDSGAMDLRSFYETWTGTTLPKGSPVPLDEKFLAALAAGAFIQGVDMPYQLVDMPGLPKDDKKARDKLFDFYHSDIVKKKLLQPVKDVPQPELQFLDLLQKHKTTHNTLGRAFWNRAHSLWVKDEKALTAAFKELQAKPGDAAAKAAYEKAVTPHRDKLLEAVKPVREALDAINKEGQRISDWFAANPDALGKGTQVAKRDPLNLTSGWIIQIDEYLGPPSGQTRGRLLDGSGPKIDPPWAKEPLKPID